MSQKASRLVIMRLKGSQEMAPNLISQFQLISISQKKSFITESNVRNEKSHLLNFPLELFTKINRTKIHLFSERFPLK